MSELFECPLCHKRTKVIWAEGETERQLACIHCARTDFEIDPETGVLLGVKQVGGRFNATKGNGSK